LIKIISEIEENWKFNGQLKVKLKKSMNNDKNKKGVEIQGWHWSSSGAKLHKIRSLGSIRGVIDRNHKSKD
jgi:hypothetical protein